MTTETDAPFQRFMRSAFSPETLKTIESWWRTPLITDRDAFERIPSRNESAAMRAPGVETIESLNLPKLGGCSLPHWMRGKDGSLSVHKLSLFTDILEGDTALTGASEAISSTLGRHVGVLVAPIQVWQTGPGNRPEDYYTASLRIFADSRDRPPEQVLANHTVQLAKFGPFDTWINNPDRRLANIVYGTAWQDPAGTPKPAQTIIAGIDHAFLHNDWVTTHPILKHDKTGSEYVSPNLWRQVREEITAAREVKAVIRAIENTPDALIKNTVMDLPDALYPAPAREAKAKRIDVLRYRRDNIESLTMKAAGLV
jgi:hypothetical protein